jgi:P-type Cu+ transporter
MEETSFLEIKGMHCAACAVRIEKAVSKMEGVIDVNVSLTTEKGRFTFNKNRTNIQDIIKKINNIGFAANEFIHNNPESDQLKRKEMRILQTKFILSALLTFPLAWAMFAHFSVTSFIKVPELFLNPLFQLAITIPIQFVIGFQFYESAWKALKNGSANMDVLVVLSTSAAFFYSHYLTITALKTGNHTHAIGMFYETSAFIMTFILLGKLLEAKTKMRTTESIKKLHQLQPKMATLDLNGKQSKVAIDQILPGDVIWVKPGERIPVDGQVVTGNSMIDESLLTGESISVEKRIGDNVYAGTINQNGLMKIQVTKKDSETTLSQIIRIVEEAQASKAPIQYIADKITAVFVPGVFLFSVVTFIVWYFIFLPGNFYEAIEKVIAVLIIACPCALGLATPTSVMVASGRAAQLGILFKEGKFLELLGKNNIVMFDKTGTITKGEPQVTHLYVEQFSENAFLELIGAVESVSTHPVAKAIVMRAESKIHNLPNPTEVEFFPGYGVKATVNGKKVVISNPRYYKNNYSSIPGKASLLVEELEEEGKTVMIVTVDARFVGIVAVADEIKPTSKRAISRLKGLGLEVMMLTGDNKSTALDVAKQAGIKSLYAEVTPQEKAAIVQQLQKEGNRVVMVGDGINDAPALTVADVGIAIGTGSDIAIESADVTVITGDLNRVVDAIKISKKTIINIKQNFLWAFLYNIFMIPFAMFGLLAPWVAGAAMAFSSVSVILNSLRLKKVKV